MLKIEFLNKERATFRMKDVIVGGSGWASRSALAVLQVRFGRELQDISVYGSVPRRELLESGGVLDIKQWSDIPEEVETRFFLPFAFLTVDKFDLYGEEKFREINKGLIQKSVNFIAMNKPKYCVLISSGIVSPNLTIKNRSRSYQVYRELKIAEEEAIRSQCRSIGTNFVACRLFSASGRLVRNFEHFAISNFIYQGLVHGKIKVNSNFPVLRKYLDMEQLLEICLLAAQSERELCFDSTGTLIELHDLASLCATELDIKYSSVPFQAGEADNYFSGSRDSETLAALYNVSLFPIERQIQETILGVKNVLYKGSFN